MISIAVVNGIDELIGKIFYLLVVCVSLNSGWFQLFRNFLKRFNTVGQGFHGSKLSLKLTPTLEKSSIHMYEWNYRNLIPDDFDGVFSVWRVNHNIISAGGVMRIHTYRLLIVSRTHKLTINDFFYDIST